MEAYKLLGEAQVTGENIEKFVKQSKTHQKFRSRHWVH